MFEIPIFNKKKTIPNHSHHQSHVDTEHHCDTIGIHLNQKCWRVNAREYSQISAKLTENQHLINIINSLHPPPPHTPANILVRLNQIPQKQLELHAHRRHRIHAQLLVYLLNAQLQQITKRCDVQEEQSHQQISGDQTEAADH